MIPIDFQLATATLDTAFTEVHSELLRGSEPRIDSEVKESVDAVFSTETNSPREALLGIALVRLQSRETNLRLPYANQSPTAFNGRDLHERVVNPFLQQHRIPSSRGPYLAMFRRDFRFDESRRDGQRNKKLFDSFLSLIGYLEMLESDPEILAFLKYLLYRFAKLREAADIPLSRLKNISLDQFRALIAGLLGTPSGGRVPVILVVGALQSVSDRFGIGWKIEYQGINVSDAASGVDGDITVRLADKIILAAEVTERPVGKERLIATFQNKISLSGVRDYLFFVRTDSVRDEAKRQAAQYFAQGYEVNFVIIEDWLPMVLATIGPDGRLGFNERLLDMLGEDGVPRLLKVAWNDQITKLTAV